MRPDMPPIRERPDLPAEERLRLLEVYCGQLWDQVWWLSLTPERRAQYEAEGYTHPIEKFYEPE